MKYNAARLFLYQADGVPSQADPQATPPQNGQTPDSPSASPAADKTQTVSKTIETLPKEVQDYIRSLREENKSYRLAREKTEADAKTQQEADLAQKQEWQKLADQRKDEIQLLKPKAELADKLTEIFADQMNEEIKDWPEEIKNMAPSKEVSAIEMAEWLRKARPVAARLIGQSSNTAQRLPGNSRGPDPKSQTSSPTAKSPVTDMEPLIDMKRRF